MNRFEAILPVARQTFSSKKPRLGSIPEDEPLNLVRYIYTQPPVVRYQKSHKTKLYIKKHYKSFEYENLVIISFAIEILAKYKPSEEG